jgi:hypothetical protein
MSTATKTRAEAAQALHAEGWTVLEIAAHMGISKATAYRYTNPEKAEQSRAASLAWKAANRDRTRQYDAAARAASMAAHRWGSCDNCDGPLSKSNRSGRCQPCGDQMAADEATEVVAMWLAGATYPEIRDFLGCGKTALGVYFGRLRAAGYPVPRRHPGGSAWRDPMPTEPIIVRPGWAGAGDAVLSARTAERAAA